MGESRARLGTPICVSPGALPIAAVTGGDARLKGDGSHFAEWWRSGWRRECHAGR